MTSEYHLFLEQFNEVTHSCECWCKTESLHVRNLCYNATYIWIPSSSEHLKLYNTLNMIYTSLDGRKWVEA